MPTVNKLREPQILVHATAPVPPDERAWQSWLTKGRLQDERTTRVRLEAVKVASIIGLLAAAALWSYVAPYEIAFRFAVAAACLFVMFHALRLRHRVLAGLFGAVTLLYNPILPLFNASWDLQRLVLAIASVPFIASLGWRNVRKPL